MGIPTWEKERGGLQGKNSNRCVAIGMVVVKRLSPVLKVDRVSVT